MWMIILGLAAVGARAQDNGERKISFATTLGVGIPVMGSLSFTPVAWQILGYYALTDRWSAGAGTGLSFYEKLLIPVYADVKYQIGRERRFTPFAEMAAGYAFVAANDADGGLFMNPSFGLQYPLPNGTKLQLAVGCERQELERRKIHFDSYFQKEFEEKSNHHTISIRFGWRF